MKSTSSRNVNAHYLRLVSVLYTESSFCYENIWPRKKPVTWICSFLFKRMNLRKHTVPGKPAQTEGPRFQQSSLPWPMMSEGLGTSWCLPETWGEPGPWCPKAWGRFLFVAHPLNGLAQKRITVKTARLPGQAFAYSPNTVPFRRVPG